jgi:hypothetical protein
MTFLQILNSFLKNSLLFGVCSSVEAMFAATGVSVLLPDELTQVSPSMKDGVDADAEMRHRVFGCEIIQHAGILLKCPQVVMVTAQNILHRFFYR